MHFVRTQVQNFSPFNIIYHTLFLYPVPVNINYFWNFGILALLTLISQILTGIFLGMHYVSSATTAFSSIEHIMRDVNYGWLFRYLHANGASVFFFVVFSHVFRGLYFGSYAWPRTYLWNLGVIILLLMIITAFLGYVLPWGQMSFWAATVITNLASAIPIYGNDILTWLWGGFSVSTATLTRFYSLHFLLPFVIFALSIVHIIFLHIHGSSNPVGSHSKETISFAPYFFAKDLYSFIIYALLFSFLVFFTPNFVNHPDNYILANPLSTPKHIVPEWYLLPFYAILRSIPNKILGVCALLLAILVLMTLPFGMRLHLVGRFSPLSRLIFWFFFIISIMLSYLGGMPATEPYIMLAQLFTFLYFILFFLFFPGLDRFELFMNFKRLRWTKMYGYFFCNSTAYNMSTFRTVQVIWTIYYNLPFFRLTYDSKQFRWSQLKFGRCMQAIFFYYITRVFPYVAEIVRVEGVIYDKHVLISDFLEYNTIKHLSARGFSQNSRGFRSYKYISKIKRLKKLRAKRRYIRVRSPGRYEW